MKSCRKSISRASPASICANATYCATGLDVLVPQGTFFCSINIENLVDDDDLAFCLRLPKDVGVAAVPMSLSWHKRREARHLIRLCFAKEDETLHQAIDAFARWMETR